MKHVSLFILASLFLCLGACADDGTDSAVFAIDTDGSGTVDCADLDHVEACLHDPHAPACAVADVNHDGLIDDGDLHDIHDGLAATGHHCTEPEHHDGDGEHTGDHL